jgi:hypothetical protein
MDSDKLNWEEATLEEAPRKATTSDGELDFHPNSVDLNSNGSLEKPIGSPSTAPEKPVDTKKGKGLRKWRRIKRESIKEGSAEFTKEESPADLADDLAQLAQIHKRRIPLPDSSRNAPAGDEREYVEGDSSVASVESRNTGLNEVSDYASPFVPSKSPELEHPLMINGPPLFSIGAIDSDNSEDRSSKSSTAASAPKSHNLGLGRERGRHKGISLFSTSQRASRAKAETGRSHRLKTEAENSNSNSNVVSNGKHSDKSVNYDGGDNSDEGLQGEVRSGYYRENESMENPGHFESGTIFEEKDVNNGADNPTLDPFIESMMFLRTAQEALERGTFWLLTQGLSYV